jgi:hypothetical protein
VNGESYLIFNFYFKQMETRSYMFSTAKKRSTLLENKGIEYLVGDVGSPGTISRLRA